MASEGEDDMMEVRTDDELIEYDAEEDELGQVFVKDEDDEEEDAMMPAFEEYILDDNIEEEEEEEAVVDLQVAPTQVNDASTLYHCSVCNVDFLSVNEHVQKYHSEQEVLLEVSAINNVYIVLFGFFYKRFFFA